MEKQISRSRRYSRDHSSAGNSAVDFASLSLHPVSLFGPCLPLAHAHSHSYAHSYSHFHSFTNPRNRSSSISSLALALAKESDGGWGYVSMRHTGFMDRRCSAHSSSTALQRCNRLNTLVLMTAVPVDGSGRVSVARLLASQQAHSQFVSLCSRARRPVGFRFGLLVPHALSGPLPCRDCFLST